jgi:parallel beta-helix repeat protein
MKAKRNLCLMSVIGLVVLHGSILWATPTVAVGTCRPTLPQFPTITAAITGAPDGGTILVCPGTYPEQVTIYKNLTITGISSGNSGLPVIVPPAGGLVQNATSYNVSSGFLGNAALAVQIIVSPGMTANINNLSLDATNNNLPDCGPIPVGIYYADSSGTVNHVAVKNELATCTFNGFAGVMAYPWGDGVFVQSDGSQPAVVSVLASSFHNVGWMALHADNTGATVTLKNNTAVGPGITYGNGILVESGAAATAVTNNAESNALLNGQPTGFWGILLNGCAGNSIVNNNVVSNSSAGIVAYCSGNTIANNRVFDSQGDGIQVCGSGNTIQGNTINDSGEAGVNLLQGCADQNNIVSGNLVDGACTALLVGTDAVSNTTSPNSLHNTKYLLLSGSSCN